MSSVLETFYILYETDSTDLIKGNKDAEKSIKGVLKTVQKTDEGTVQLGKKFNNLASNAVAAFASIFAVSQLLSGIKGVAEQSTQLDNLSIITGESATEITNWGRAVQSVGGDAKSFEGTIRSLNASLAEAVMTGRNDVTDAFRFLEINAFNAAGQVRPLLELLPDLAEAFGGLDRQRALSLGRRLGLDEGTIILLSQGRAKVEELVDRQKEMNLVNDAQIQKLKLLNAMWNSFNNFISDVAVNIITFDWGGVLDGLSSGLNDALIRWEFLGDYLEFFIEIWKDLFNLPFGDFFGMIAKGWGLIFDKIESVYKIYQKFTSGGEGFIEFFGFGDFGESSKKAMEDFHKKQRDNTGGGQGFLKSASAFPLQSINSSITSSSSSTNKNTEVKIANITVNTQATNVADIAQSIATELQSQLKFAIDNSDDGIVA